jgi:ribosomal-protein-alanine N-acetyltransferase
VAIGFLRATPAEEQYFVESEQHYLRTPSFNDHAEWAELRAQSRAFLAPWEPTWPRDDLTRMAFRRRIRRYQRDMREDLGVPFFVFRKSDDALIGGLTLAHIRRGAAQSCSLGYWMGAPYAGQGHMTAAVRLAVPFAFNRLKLHRVEAACLPQNERSIRLLERVGFQREGYAYQYLCINGTWRDHILFGVVSGGTTSGPVSLAGGVSV